MLWSWLYIRRLLTEPGLWANDTPPFTPQKVDDLLLYITLGVVLGGRLGYVLFYDPAKFTIYPSLLFRRLPADQRLPGASHPFCRQPCGGVVRRVRVSHHLKRLCFEISDEA